MENIKKQIKLNCSAAKAWNLWTSNEGLKNFFGEHNHIELQLNGAFEIYFSMEAPIGQRGSENCKVLSFVENEMLSFTWNAPPSIPSVRNSNKKTFVVLTFINQSDNTSLLKLDHGGWIYEGEDWLTTWNYFNQAWNFVLENLTTHINK